MIPGDTHLTHIVDFHHITVEHLQWVVMDIRGLIMRPTLSITPIILVGLLTSRELPAEQQRPPVSLREILKM